MGDTPLAMTAREAFLNRPDQPRGAIGHHEQRVTEAAPAHVLEERPAALRVLFGPRA